MPVGVGAAAAPGEGEGRLSRLPAAAAAAGEDCAALMAAVDEDGVTDAGRTSGRLRRLVHVLLVSAAEAASSEALRCW